MSFTLQNLQDAAAHAVGKSTFDTGNSPSNCANLALEHIVNECAWSWRTKITTLSVIANQSYVALPSDFSELTAVRGGVGLNTVLVPSTLDRIFQLRQFPYLSSQAVTYYAVNQTDQASGTAVSTYQLELYPTPTATASDVMQLAYMRQIVPLTTGTQVANIPGQMQQCLWLLTRGYAELTELNQPGLNMQLGLADLEKRRMRDAMTQPINGRIHGTVEDQWRGDYTGNGWMFCSDTPVNV